MENFSRMRNSSLFISYEQEEYEGNRETDGKDKENGANEGEEENYGEKEEEAHIEDSTDDYDENSEDDEDDEEISNHTMTTTTAIPFIPFSISTERYALLYRQNLCCLKLLDVYYTYLQFKPSEQEHMDRNWYRNRNCNRRNNDFMLPSMIENENCNDNETENERNLKSQTILSKLSSPTYVDSVTTLPPLYSFLVSSTKSNSLLSKDKLSTTTASFPNTSTTSIDFSSTETSAESLSPFPSIGDKQANQSKIPSSMPFNISSQTGERDDIVIPSVIEGVLPNSKLESTSTSTSSATQSSSLDKSAKSSPSYSYSNSSSEPLSTTRSSEELNEIINEMTDQALLFANATGRQHLINLWKTVNLYFDNVKVLQSTHNILSNTMNDNNLNGSCFIRSLWTYELGISQLALDKLFPLIPKHLHKKLLGQFIHLRGNTDYWFNKYKIIRLEIQQAKLTCLANDANGLDYEDNDIEMQEAREIIEKSNIVKDLIMRSRNQKKRYRSFAQFDERKMARAHI